MNHAVLCSRCTHKFDHGVTRVRRFIIFHFCAPCISNHRAECDAIMEKVAAPITKGAAA